MILKGKHVCRICGVNGDPTPGNPIILNGGKEFAHKLCLELYPPGRALAELNRRLLVLASWCQSRAAGEHDAETTMTMLERKMVELRIAYHTKLCGISTPPADKQGEER